MLKASFELVSPKFEIRDGYKTPVYPKGLTPEQIGYIKERAANVSGTYVAGLTPEDTWYSVLATDIASADRRVEKGDLQENPYRAQSAAAAIPAATPLALIA